MAKSAAAAYTTSTSVRGYVKAVLAFRRLTRLMDRKREQQRPTRDKLTQRLAEMEDRLAPLQTKIQRAHVQTRLRLLKLKGRQLAEADRILDRMADGERARALEDRLRG